MGGYSPALGEGGDPLPSPILSDPESGVPWAPGTGGDPHFS